MCLQARPQSSDLQLIPLYNSFYFYLMNDAIDLCLKAQREIDNYIGEFRFLRNYFESCFCFNSRGID